MGMRRRCALRRRECDRGSSSTSVPVAAPPPAGPTYEGAEDGPVSLLPAARRTRVLDRSASILACLALITACGDGRSEAPADAGRGSGGAQVDRHAGRDARETGVRVRPEMTPLDAGDPPRLVVRGGPLGPTRVPSVTPAKILVPASAFSLVNVTVFPSSAPSEFSTVRVTPEGFEARFEGDQLRGPGLLTVTSSDSTNADGVFMGVPELTGRIDLGPLPPRGAGPIVAAGRVADTDGRPLARVGVAVGVFAGTVTLPGRIHARTDDRGHFEAHAHVSGFDGVLVETEETGWATEAVARAEVGAMDVVVVAHRRPVLTGTVKVLDGGRERDFDIVVDSESEFAPHVYVNGLSAGHEKHQLRFIADSKFVIDGVTDGRCSVRILPRASTKQLGAIEDWDFPGAGVTLPPLVVRSGVVPVTVRVESMDGGSAAGKRVWLRDFGCRVPFARWTSDDLGVVTALRSVDTPQIAVVESADGVFESASFSGDHVTIRLSDRGPTRVRVQLPPVKQRSSDEERWCFVLQWTASLDADAKSLFPGDEKGDPRSGVRLRMETDESGRASGTVRTPGWYRAAAALVRDDREVRASGPFDEFFRIDCTSESQELILGEDWEYYFR